MVDRSRQLIDGFSAAAEAALDSEKGKLPETLYHFTDSGGLNGILVWKNLWASIVTGLNDLSELDYGLGIVLDRLKQSDGPMCAEIESHLSIDTMGLPGHGRFLPFVTSFCEREELAVQWLHYGRNGTGCALAFEAARLKLSWLALRRVLYEPDKQHRVIDAVLDVARTTASRLEALRRLGEGELEYLAHTTAVHLWEAAVSFKHASFADEREWRLITHETIEPTDLSEFGAKNVDLKSRVTASGRVVAYLEVKYDPPPLKEIVLGHSAPQSETDPSFQYLLARCNLKGITIRRSDVRVRA